MTDPDVSRLDDYARRRRMHFKWNTELGPDGWRSNVSLAHQGHVGPCWVGKGDSEQAALDDGMEHAISYYEGTRTAGQGITHAMPPTG